MSLLGSLPTVCPARISSLRGGRWWHAACTRVAPHMKITRRLLLAIATLGVAQPLYAADVVAASCERSAVQLAINTAVTGDRVLVPAGACSWTAGVLVANKHITLQGGGATSTVITISGNVLGGVNLSMTASRVTGFGFVLTSGRPDYRRAGTELPRRPQQFR